MNASDSKTMNRVSYLHIALVGPLSNFFAACSAGIGMLGLLGWALQLPILATFGKGLIPMAPNTAFLFLVIGSALMLRIQFPESRATFLVGMFIGFAIALSTAVLLYFSVQGIHPQIENLGFSSFGTVAGAPIGHMSPLTATCFVLIGVSFMAVLSYSTERLWLVHSAFVLACLVAALSMVLLLAYWIGAPVLYGSELIPPALSTSLAFFTLAISLLATSGSHFWSGSKKEDVPFSTDTYVLVLVFVLTTLGILTAGYFYYRSQENQYRSEIEHQLTGITELKVGQIVQWRKERFGDAAAIYDNPAFTQLVRRFLERPQDSKTKQWIERWFQGIEQTSQYDAIFLFDRQGVQRIATDNSRAPQSKIVKKSAVEIVRTGEIAFEDFYRNEFDGRVYLALLVPIRERDTKNVIAVVEMRIDPNTYIYPLINRWPIPSRSAETSLLRRDGNDALFLNELRFRKNAILKFRIPLSNIQVPAVKVLLGQKGIVEGADYRGVRVVAAVQSIPGSPWFMVARMDLTELYAPLEDKLWMTVILMAALILGSGTGVGLVWRHQRGLFYRQQHESVQAQLASEFRYRRLFETAKDGILILDADTGTVMDVNPFVIDMFGFTRQELLGKKVWNLGLIEDIVANESSFLELKSKEYGRYENLTMETAGGQLINVELVINVYFVNNRKVVQCNVRDITERIRAQEMSVRLAAIVESSDDAIIGKDLNGTITSWNAGAEKIFGISSKEAVGRSIMQIIPQERLSEEERILEHIRRHESVQHFETVRVTKDGKLIDVSLTVSPIKDVAGNIVGASKVLRDITERKQAEAKIRKLNAELETRVVERTAQWEAANKELEAFSYSVSHDLRAPLRAIDGFAQIILEEYESKLDDEGKRLLNIIRSNTKKMGELISDLLSLSRITRGEMKSEWVDMAKLVDSVYNEVVAPKIQAQYSVSIEPLPNVSCDPSLMRQVWTNLISNAVKFTSKKNVRKIEIGGHTEDGMANYFIRDSGVGFDPRYTQKLFGVFQRLHTSDEFEGSGVGLAIVQRIVNRHGGQVRAEGTLGEGATFYYSLPSEESHHGNQQ